jgi:hypothetical protein
MTSRRALEVSVCPSGAVGVESECCLMSIDAEGLPSLRSWCEGMNPSSEQLWLISMSARVSKALRCSARYSHAIRRTSVISSTLAEHQRVRSMTWKKIMIPCHLMPEHLIEHSIGQFTPVGSSNMDIIVGLSTHVAHMKNRRRLNHTGSCGVRGVNVLPGFRRREKHTLTHS